MSDCENITQDQIDRFWSKVNKSSGLGPDGECWEWTAGDKNREGYGGFYLRQIDNTINCHKFAFLITHNFGLQDIPDGIVIRHSCNHPPCVRPSHLLLGTCQDNSDDMVFAGNATTGERNHNAKLTWRKVAELRQLWATGNYTKASLAIQFGVTAAVIWHVVSNKTWVDESYIPPVFATGATPNLKVTNDQCREIRSRKQNGERVPDLAKEYGISVSQVYNIVRGEQRKEVVT